MYKTVPREGTERAAVVCFDQNYRTRENHADDYNWSAGDRRTSIKTSTGTVRMEYRGHTGGMVPPVSGTSVLLVASVSH